MFTEVLVWRFNQNFHSKRSAMIIRAAPRAAVARFNLLKRNIDYGVP